jgi:hypothetical protein
MAKEGLSFADPFLAKSNLGPEANPYAINSPTSDIGLNGLAPSLADMAAVGQQIVKQSQFTMPELKQAPAIAFNATENKLYVNGITFDADDATTALQSEQYLSYPSVGLPTTGNWTPIDQNAYSQYINSIRNPSLGRLARKNFGIGVDNMQLLAGRGLQLLGAEQTGQAIVDQQVRDIQKSAPFVREFSNIQSGGDAVDWFVANLAQQGPNLLESLAVGVAGFGAGTAVGGPAAGLYAGVAGILGKSATKQAILAAAKKKAAGEALDAAESKLLRTAAGTAGALAASYGSNIATGAADIYGEMREQGVPADDASARLAALAGSLPYAALETLPEFVLASRIFGGIKGTGTDLASIQGKTALGTGAKRAGELLKRGATGAIVGGPLEGATEAGQEALVLGLSGQDLSSPEAQKRLLESFAAGFGVGSPLGGIANLRKGKTPVGDQPTNLLNPEQSPEPSTALTITEPPAGVPQGPVTTGGMMGRPDMITAPDGTTRPSRPSDTIFAGEVAPGQFGQQGVLDIFGPEGATIAELQQRSTLVNPIGIPYLGEQPAEIPGQGQLQFAPPPPAPTPVNAPVTQMELAMQQAEVAKAIEQQQIAQEQQRQAELNRLAIVAQNQRQLDLAQPAPEPVAPLPMRETRAPNPQQLQLFGRGQAPKPSMRERVRRGIPAPQQKAPVVVAAPKVDLRRGRQLSLFTQEGEPTMAALRSAGTKQPYRSIPEVGGSQIPPTGRVVTPATVAKALAKKTTTAKLKAKEKPNAVQEPSTAQVDVRKQTGTGEGVRGQDAKLRQATREGAKATQEKQGKSLQDVIAVQEAKAARLAVERDARTQWREKRDPKAPTWEKLTDAQRKEWTDLVEDKKASMAEADRIGGIKPPEPTPPKPTGKATLKKEPKVETTKATPAAPVGEQRLKAPKAQATPAQVPQTSLASLVAQVTAPAQEKEKKSGEASQETLDAQQALEAAIDTVETTSSPKDYAIAMNEIVDVYVTETNQATKLFKTANEFLFGAEPIPVAEFTKALRAFAITMPSINPRSRLYKLLNDYNLLTDPKIGVRVSTKKDEDITAAVTEAEQAPEEIDRAAIQLADLINNREGWINKKQLTAKAEALFKQVEDAAFVVGERGSIEDFFKDGKPIVVQKPGTNKYVLSSVEEAKVSREEFAKAHAAARKELRDIELEAAEEEQRTALELKFQQESGVQEDDNILGGLANYYRVDEKASQPMKAGALRLMANKFVSKLARKPKLHVFQNLDDMRKANPKLFREAAAARKAGDFEAVNAAGMAWGNTVVLFADNINGEKHANFIMAHEILGHVGFRGLFSDAQLNKILQSIADSDVQVNNAAVVLSEAQNIPFLEAVEEVLSDRAAAIDSSTMMRFWTWMKNQLNKLGFKFNDDAARYLVSLSRKYVRQGVGRSEVNLKTLLQEAATMRELEQSDVEVLRFAQLAPQGQQTAAMNAMNQNVTTTGGLEGIMNWLNNNDTKVADLRRKYDGSKVNAKDTMKNFFGLLRTQDDMARDSKGASLVFSLTQRKGEMQQKLKTKYSKLTQLAHEAKFLMFGDGPEPMESQQAGQLLALGSLLKGNQFTDTQLQSKFEAPIAYSTELGQIIVNPDAFESLAKAGTLSVEDFKKGFDVQMGFTEKPMTDEYRKQLEAERDQEVATIEARKKRDLDRIKRKIDGAKDAKVKTSLQATYDKTEDKFDSMLRSTKLNYKKQLDSNTYSAPNYVNTKDMADFAWAKDLTEDSIQYKMYLQFREAINESQMDVLNAKYAGAMYEQERVLNRGIDRAFKKTLTEAERRFITAVSDEYDRIAMEGASYENNRFKMNEVSQADAVDYVEMRFARSFYNDNALNDFATKLPNYTPDEVKTLVTGLRDKLRVKIDPDTDAITDSSIWPVAYAMEERSTFTISLNDDSLYAKRSIAGGYAPLSRRGKFQVRVQAYTIDADGNEEPVKLHQGQQDSLPLFMTEKKDESIGYAEELNGLLTGEYTMRDANNRVVPVYLKAIVSDVETTPALVDIMHYDDVMYALSRLGVQMPVADREILIKKVTAQNSRARANLQRAGVPGWDKDVVRSSSAFLEQQAYVAANKTFRHQFDGVLEDNRNWFGDRDKLAELKAKWEAATGPAKELAAREYFQEKFYFEKANEKVGDTNVLRGNWYKERAKSQLDWQDSTGDIVFADDFWNNNQFSLSARTWAAVAQLGGSIATGITQMLSLPTNSWAYLSSYNPENNFGLGLGAGRAGALLSKFAISAANPKYINVDFLQAQLDELERTGATESKDGLTAGELRFLKDLTEEQRLDAAQFNALTGTVRGRKGFMGNPTFQKFVQTWMFPFSYSEQFNRRVTVLAAYRGEYERQIAAGVSPMKADDAARNAADKALDATQGDYSQYNRPAFFRGGLMSFVYMYKQYPIIMLQLLKNMDRNGQIIMLGSLILLSGLRGLPGADDLLDIIDGLMQRLGLQSGSVEKEFARLTRGAFGDELGAALTPVMMRGLLDATTGWSFSNRLGLGDIVPGTALFKPSASAQEKLREVENLAGAPTSFMLGAFEWATGTIPAVITGRQPISKILTDAPVRALKNATESWKYANTGAILDSKGYVVSQDVTAWEIIGKAVGFYPSRAQVQMDWMMADGQEQRYGQMIRSEAIREAVAARLNGDSERLANVKEYVREWNADVKGTRLEIRNFTGGVNRAYREASKPLAARALKSSARAGRQEAEELAALYGFEISN